MLKGSAYVIRQGRKFYQLLPGEDGSAKYGLVVPSYFMFECGKRVWDRYKDNMIDSIDENTTFDDIYYALDFC